MEKFKTGDKVICIKGTPYLRIGDVGIILETFDNNCFVKWEKPLLPSDKGWYAIYDQIELDNKPVPKAAAKKEEGWGF